MEHNERIQWSQEADMLRAKCCNEHRATTKGLSRYLLAVYQDRLCFDCDVEIKSRIRRKSWIARSQGGWPLSFCFARLFAYILKKSRLIRA